MLTIPTISQEDVVGTLLLFERQSVKEEFLNMVYEFASELTGVSVDELCLLVDEKAKE